MLFCSRHSCFLVALVLTYLELAYGLVNVTVGRDSGEILYEPTIVSGNGLEWREAWPGVRISEHTQAKVTFKFKGVAVYYKGWNWTQPTSFIAKVDNEPDVLVDLLDPRNFHDPADANSTVISTLPVTILLSGGLTESSHTVVLRKNPDQRSVIVGSFIYTTDDPPATSSVTPRPSSTAANSAPQSSNRSILWKPLVALLSSVAFTNLI